MDINNNNNNKTTNMPNIQGKFGQVYKNPSNELLL